MSEQQPPLYGSVVEEQPRGPHTGYSSEATEALPQYQAPKEEPYGTQLPTSYDPPSQDHNVSTPDTDPDQETVVRQGETDAWQLRRGDINVYGYQPFTMECPSCHANMTTNISHRLSAITWLAALCICMFGGFLLACCLIPFFNRGFKDVRHRCSKCNVHIGTYTRLEYGFKQTDYGIIGDDAAKGKGLH